MKNFVILLLVFTLGNVSCASAYNLKRTVIPLFKTPGLFDTASNRAKLSKIALELPVSDKSDSEFVIPEDVNQAVSWLYNGLPENYLKATNKGYRFAPQLWSPYRMSVNAGIENFLIDAWKLSSNSPLCKEIENAGFLKAKGCLDILLRCLRGYGKTRKCDLHAIVAEDNRIDLEMEWPKKPPEGCNANQAEPYDSINGVIFGQYTYAHATQTCGKSTYVYLLGKGWIKPSDIKECIIITRSMPNKLKNALSPNCKFEPEGLGDFYKID